MAVMPATRIYEGTRIPVAVPDDPRDRPGGPLARRHPHDQLRAEPPVDARCAPADRRPRRGARRRDQGGDRLPAHRLREDDGVEDVLEGDHVPRADRLPVLPGERARVRARDREAARPRDAREGDLDADVPLGAEPHPLAPRVARHVRARARRDLDVLVRVPRAGHGARPVRDGHRRAHAHPLLPGRRPGRGHPRGLLRPGARLRAAHAACGRRLRGPPQQQQDLARADEGDRAALRRGRARPRAVGPDAPRVGRRLGPPEEHALPLLRPGRLRRARLSERRRLRPVQGAHGRDAHLGAHRQPVRHAPRGAPRRRRGSRTTGRSCCRPARSSTRRWSR